MAIIITVTMKSSNTTQSKELYAWSRDAILIYFSYQSLLRTLSLLEAQKMKTIKVLILKTTIT